MSNEMVNESRPMWYKNRLIDSLWLKIIGYVFMIFDHVGFMFLNPDSIIYTIFRDVGRIAMPIFIFLAVEGVYYTRDYWMYFIRLAFLAIIMDGVAFVMYYGFNDHSIVPGNIFTDLAMGSMAVYFLKAKNWKSLLAVFPIAFSVLACFSIFTNNVYIGGENVNPGFQNFINMDYNLFSMCLFIGFFLAHEGANKYLEYLASRQNFDKDFLKADGKLRLYINIFTVVALVIVTGIFQIMWDINPYNPLIPSLGLGGMKCESWCCLAGVFIMLYDGRPGFRNRWVRYSMYFFYPVHLVILWLISLLINL